ncbi:MAG: hypothetical protein JW910_23050, partial [Anaerolineae bacterium]|nr:hypothetical protein [Anaerolineae bacterium]
MKASHVLYATFLLAALFLPATRTFALTETSETRASPQEGGPFIETVEPGEGRCGSEMDIFITGRNLQEARVYIPDGIEVETVENIDDSTLRAFIVILENAPPGPRPVGVVSEWGEFEKPEAFTVICGEPPGERPRAPDLSVDADDGGTGGGDDAVVAIVVVVTTVVVLGGITITLRHTIKVQKRKEWQNKAQEKDPSLPCQHCTYTCRKRKM